MDKERATKIMQQIKAGDEVTIEQAYQRTKVLQDKLNAVHEYYNENEEWFAATHVSVIAGLWFVDEDVTRFMAGNRKACSVLLTEMLKEVKDD